LEEVKPTLKAKITTWYTLDSDVDPYIAYLVEASYGDRSSSVYRRFNAFKSLNGKLPKSCAEAKKLFPSAKPFEGHHFSWEYVTARKQKLQAFLDSILANEEMWQDETFIEFLGLTPSEDPRGDEIFDLAIDLTKWRLWIWKRIPYDKKEEALSKIVIEEIKREMWYDLTSGLPNVATLRKTAIQGLYKAISATVGPPVSAGFKAAFEALEPVKPKIDDVITKVLDKIIEVEDSVKKQLTEKISEALKPVGEQLTAVVASLSEKILPTAVKALEEVKPAVDKLDAEITRLAKEGAENTDELEKVNKETLKAIEERVSKMLQDVTADAVAAAKSKINLEPLLTMLDPFEKFGEFVRPFTALFPDIGPHLYVLRTMLEYRNKIAKLNIAEGTAPVDDLLDREEASVLYRRWWPHWDYRWAVWSLYYQSWGIPELSGTARAFRDHGLLYARLHKKVMKKWAFAFGDHLHERAKTATPADWNETVSQCFVLGYQKAKEWFRPRAMAILADYTNDFVYRLVGAKIESFALKAIDPIVSTLASAVPAPVNEVVEVEQIATDSVRDALHQMMEKVVADGIFAPASKAWAGSK
jgi:gas vesicle protein